MSTLSDIFISYASEDKARIKPLVDALRQHGWSVWWDRTILAGQVWEREIEQALEAARCLIVVWSQASIQSEWVWTEADEGKRRGILVPVLLDPVLIPLAFRRIQAANLIGWRGEMPNAEFEELALAATALLDRTAADAPRRIAEKMPIADYSETAPRSEPAQPKAVSLPCHRGFYSPERIADRQGIASTLEPAHAQSSEKMLEAIPPRPNDKPK